MKGKKMLFFALCAAFILAIAGCQKSSVPPLTDVPIAYDKVDATRMSRETSISRKAIASAFGVPYNENANAETLAQTFEEWEFVYRYTAEGSAEEKTAFAKMTGLAKTLEEWEFVYRKTPEGSAERKAAFAKMTGLAKTFEE